MKFFVLATLASVVASSFPLKKPTTYPLSSRSSKPLPRSIDYITPYHFQYDVDIDNYASFGDTRVSDESGYVSGSYHVQLPDGRHQHVNYKDEGNGYVVQVQYKGDSPKYSASNVVEYKDKYVKSSIKSSQNAKVPWKESVDGNCSDSRTSCYPQSSHYEKAKHQIYFEPLAMFYKEQVSTTTPSYRDDAITRAVPLTKGNVDKKTHRVATTTEFSAANVVFTYAPEEYGYWQIMHTTPKYLKPISTTEKPITTTRIVPSRLTTDYKIPSSINPRGRATKANTIRYPATTPTTVGTIARRKPVSPAVKIPGTNAKKPVSLPPAQMNSAHFIATTRRPSIATALFKALLPVNGTHRVFPVSTTPEQYRSPVYAKLDYKTSALNTVPVHTIHVSTNTPKMSTTTPAYRSRYTTKRPNMSPIYKKPFLVYKPPVIKNPIKNIDPYVIAPSYQANTYAVPVMNLFNHEPAAYTVVFAYKPAKKVVRRFRLHH